MVFATIICRVKEYSHMGLDMDIVDPDNSANIAKKLAALQTSGLDLNIHTNLSLSPEMPTTGWTSNLRDLPFVLFASLYKHYVERPINTLLMGTDSDQTAPNVISGLHVNQAVLHEWVASTTSAARMGQVMPPQVSGVLNPGWPSDERLLHHNSSSVEKRDSG